MPLEIYVNYQMSLNNDEYPPVWKYVLTSDLDDMLEYVLRRDYSFVTGTSNRSIIDKLFGIEYPEEGTISIESALAPSAISAAIKVVSQHNIPHKED